MRRERIDLVDQMFNEFQELILSYSLEVHCQCLSVQKQHGPFEVSTVPVLHSRNFDHSHFQVELHRVRTLLDPFQYESIYFLLVLHHDLKQIHFFLTNFETVSTQFASERAFRWGSGRRRLNAVPNWQCVLLKQVLSIAFRGEKYCMTIDTMTIGSHVMFQLDVFSGLRQALE